MRQKRHSLWETTYFVGFLSFKTHNDAQLMEKWWFFTEHEKVIIFYFSCAILWEIWTVMVLKILKAENKSLKNFKRDPKMLTSVLSIWVKLYIFHGNVDICMELLYSGFEILICNMCCEKCKTNKIKNMK